MARDVIMCLPICSFYSLYEVPRPPSIYCVSDVSDGPSYQRLARPATLAYTVAHKAEMYLMPMHKQKSVTRVPFRALLSPRAPKRRIV